MMQCFDRGLAAKIYWAISGEEMNCLRRNVGSLYPSNCKVKSYVNFNNMKVNMLIYCLYIMLHSKRSIIIYMVDLYIPLKCSCLNYEEQ